MANAVGLAVEDYEITFHDTQAPYKVGYVNLIHLHDSVSYECRACHQSRSSETVASMRLPAKHPVDTTPPFTRSVIVMTIGISHMNCGAVNVYDWTKKQEIAWVQNIPTRRELMHRQS